MYPFYIRTFIEGHGVPKKVAGKVKKERRD